MELIAGQLNKRMLQDLSTLGEILGWARPEEYPPRNGRSMKALKAMGYVVNEL